MLQDGRGPCPHGSLVAMGFRGTFGISISGGPNGRMRYGRKFYFCEIIPLGIIPVILSC